MTQENNQEIKSEKRYTTAVILSGVFGVVGIHHFYVERWGIRKRIQKNIIAANSP
ncbi:MAG: TM2 domain-containing protein [Bacteroidota bacterium]